MAKAEKIAQHEDPEPPKDEAAATSDAQIADTNSVVVELVASEVKVDQAVIDAGKELNDAAAAATEMLAEEAAKVKVVPATARNPARVTASQRMRVARRQREYGRKLLERTTPGVSSVNRSVRLNNQTVRMMFERTWPYIDSCAYLLMRHGGFAVGDREATALLTALQTKVTAFRDEQEKNLQAVRAVGEAAADKEDSYAVEFTQALDIKVQVRSPIANLALEGFLKGDGVLTELETLMWNGERKLSDVEMETTQIRNQVRELGVFVVRTLNNLNSRYRARAEI